MYTYIGCFRDREERLLPVGPIYKRNNEMSTSICFGYCSLKNYKYFATEHNSQCFCGNGENLNSSQYPSKKETDCNMACIGHVKKICGGIWRASVYKINHNGQNVSTTYHTPTSQKQITSNKGHQSSITKHTPTSPTQDKFVIADFSIYTMVFVPMLVLLLLAAFVVILVVWLKRKRGKDLSPCEILQYQNITDRNDSPSYADINYNEMADIINPDMNDSRHRYTCDTIQCEPPNICPSIQHEESNCKNYESLSNNRNSVEHIYQSRSIPNKQFLLSEHTNESTEETMPSSIDPSLVHYQSLTNPLEPDSHVHA